MEKRSLEEIFLDFPISFELPSEETRKIAEEHRNSQTEESRALAGQVIQEYNSEGKVTVVCPKCNTIPKVNCTRKETHGKFGGGRMTFRCKCGYISGGEIYM